jgi:hypothetical protein
MDTGEGGLSPHHLEGQCDVIMQIGTAKYGIRDVDGNFSPDKARELAHVVKAFEIKLSQGAKPGKGGVLPGAKVTAEIARIRGIPEGLDSLSPNRHPEIGNMDELLDMVERVREITGKPVGIKTAIGGRQFMHQLVDAVHRRGLGSAPDFLTIDGNIIELADLDETEFAIKEYPLAANPAEQAYRPYGIVVADNGLDWRISVAPDARLKGLDQLNRVKGSDFQVVAPTGPNEGPRAPK